MADESEAYLMEWKFRGDKKSGSRVATMGDRDTAERIYDLIEPLAAWIVLAKWMPEHAGMKAGWAQVRVRRDSREAKQRFN
jgi:hypothetical protein